MMTSMIKGSKKLVPGCRDPKMKIRYEYFERLQSSNPTTKLSNKSFS